MNARDTCTYRLEWHTQNSRGTHFGLQRQRAKNMYYAALVSGVRFRGSRLPACVLFLNHLMQKVARNGAFRCSVCVCLPALHSRAIVPLLSFCHFRRALSWHTRQKRLACRFKIDSVLLPTKTQACRKFCLAIHTAAGCAWQITSTVGGIIAGSRAADDDTHAR